MTRKFICRYLRATLAKHLPLHEIIFSLNMYQSIPKPKTYTVQSKTQVKCPWVCWGAGGGGGMGGFGIDWYIYYPIINYWLT